MSFFARWLKPKDTTTTILISVSPEKVVGAYARTAPDKITAIAYTCETPVRTHSHESSAHACVRALHETCEHLITEGAPAAHRLFGTARVGGIFICTDAPWQKTALRVDRFDAPKPFVFTKAMVDKALSAAAEAPEGYTLADESVVGVMLNGYAVHDPFGKRVSRARLLILSSFAETAMAKNIAKATRRAFHLDAVMLAAGSAVRFQAVTRLFSHERDALVLDFSRASLSVSLVRSGCLTFVTEAPNDTDTDAAWARTLADALDGVSREHPLPHTVFIVAPPERAAAYKKLLKDPNVMKRWNSAGALSVVSVDATQGSVTYGPESTPSLPLSLMAVYWGSSGNEFDN